MNILSILIVFFLPLNESQITTLFSTICWQDYGWGPPASVSEGFSGDGTAVYFLTSDSFSELICATFFDFSGEAYLGGESPSGSFIALNIKTLSNPS